MAKGNRLGILRGKLGNEVLYKITNSNNKVTQGSRPYVANVANPKTMAQAMQRMKLAPAKNFYQAFGQEILNHSFQGVKYGGRSHSKFMQLVLQNKAGNYPFVPKDTTELIPGRFPVSRGSINPIIVIGFDETDEGRNFAEIDTQFFDDQQTPFEDWINYSIRSSDGLIHFGDQITLVAICADKSGTNFYPRVARLVLDPSMYGVEDDAVQVFAKAHIGIIGAQIGFWDSSDFDYTPMAAAAVIVSRPQVSKTSGQVTWLRSDADMFVPEEILNQYNSQAAFETALQSYLPDAVNVDSDWYLNGGAAIGAAGGYPVAPGLVSKITTYLCLLRNTSLFGKWVARSINAQTGSAKAIATISRTDTTTSLQVYGLSMYGGEQGLNSTTLYPLSSAPQEFPNNAPDLANILDWLGDTITPQAAIAEQAALGNTYTLNA